MAKRILQKVGNLIARVGGPTVSRIQVRAEEIVERRAPRLAELLKSPLQPAAKAKEQAKEATYRILPVEDGPAARPLRTQGRKTVSAQPAAAKRATRKAPRRPEFKVKRGQKHNHHR